MNTLSTKGDQGIKTGLWLQRSEREMGLKGNLGRIQGSKREEGRDEEREEN